MDMAKFLPNRVDAVTILECLEHLPSPQAFLSRLRQVLTPGARIYIRVPYNHLWLRSKRICPYLPFNFEAPIHLYSFSPSNLVAYLENNGFEEVRVFPGAAEHTRKLTRKIAVSFMKGTANLLYSATGGGYIAPWVGSLVAVARYRG
jgi:2-polyprenyl-3-methyl-5-hydroxy-6-metoxy-1,4-benzoquinol methylase